MDGNAVEIYNQACELIEENGEVDMIEELLERCIGMVNINCKNKTSENRRKQKKRRRNNHEKEEAENDNDNDNANDNQMKILSSRAKILYGQIIEWKDPNSAERHYQEAIELDPTNTEGILQLARIRWKSATSTQQLCEVEDLLTQAITIGENSVDDEMTVIEAKKLLTRLLISQSHLDESKHEAAQELLSNLGYKYTLSRDIISPSTSSQVGQPIRSSRIQSKYVCAIDNILPNCLLNHLKSSFSLHSSFWSAHQYDSPSTGFFSYQHPLVDYSDDLPLRLNSPSSSSIFPSKLNSFELCIYHLWYTICQELHYVKRAKYAEWWVHMRPHCNGHKLHYDYIYSSNGNSSSSIRHPLISSVTFVDASCGGPTLVTNETIAQPQSTMGWLLHPHDNRTICFNGNQLHCVLPGYGPTPSVNNRRVTFMIAFWEENCGAPMFPRITAINSLSSSSSPSTPLLPSKKSKQKKSSSSSSSSWLDLLTKDLVDCSCDGIHCPRDAPLSNQISRCGDWSGHQINPSAIQFLDHIVESCHEMGSFKKANSSNLSKKRRIDHPMNVSLLDEQVFTHFEALNSGLILSPKSTCSLNCQGKCEQCVALAAVMNNKQTN